MRLSGHPLQFSNAANASDFSLENRAIVRDWLIDVAESQGHHRRTFYLAADLFDKAITGRI